MCSTKQAFWIMSMLCQIIKLLKWQGRKHQSLVSSRELEPEETGDAPKQKQAAEWMGLLLERPEMQQLPFLGCITFPGLHKAKESQDLAAIIPAYLWVCRKVEEGKAHFQGGHTKCLLNPLSNGDTGNTTHGVEGTVLTRSLDVPNGNNFNWGDNEDKNPLLIFLLLLL